MGTPSAVTNLDAQTRLAPKFAQWATLIKQSGYDLRVAVPGIIQSFDAAKQTAVVRIAVREKVRTPGKPPVDTTIDDLKDVPVLLPRGGGYVLTLPLKSGDECLLVIADMCISYWRLRGGVQNQFERRRHDLSDAFCIPGPWSQPRVLPAYSTTSAQLRSDDGTVVINLAPTGVTVTAPKVTVNTTGDVDITAAGVANVIASTITAKATGGTAQAVLLQAFLTWFETVYMPSVKYLTTAPSNPTGVTSTVLEAQ